MSDMSDMRNVSDVSDRHARPLRANESYQRTGERPWLTRRLM